MQNRRKFQAKMPKISSLASLPPSWASWKTSGVNLVAAIKKANLIGIGVGVCVGAAITYLLDAIFGTVIGALAYTFTTMLITAAKRREFKRQIIENIVKKHGLSYDKDRRLGV